MSERGKLNIEVAHDLNEVPQASQKHDILEIVEAIVLALVAVLTAWSGYQAERWYGQQSVLYGRSTRLRVESQALAVRSNQEKMYNTSVVVEWLKAKTNGQTALAKLLERRILPEYRAAFEAWTRTDPLHNPNAPPVATMMPEYRNANAEKSVKLDREAEEIFEQGTSARERGDAYVRGTVILATVLLMMSISQRFHGHHVRVALLVLATLLLCIPLWLIITMPRA